MSSLKYSIILPGNFTLNLKFHLKLPHRLLIPCLDVKFSFKVYQTSPEVLFTEVSN